VPLFTPLVGDTLSQGADGGTTDHFNAPFPPFVTLSVLLGKFVPTFVWSEKDVGVTDRTDCALAEGSASAVRMKKNVADLVIICAPCANRDNTRPYLRHNKGGGAFEKCSE
jgi:hypothetical protein